jgi:hypothetical protein
MLRLFGNSRRHAREICAQLYEQFFETMHSQVDTRRAMCDEPHGIGRNYQMPADSVWT